MSNKPRIEQDGRYVYIVVDGNRASEAYDGIREGYAAIGLNPDELMLEYLPNGDARVIFPLESERAAGAFVNGLLASLVDWGAEWDEK